MSAPVRRIERAGGPRHKVVHEARFIDRLLGEVRAEAAQAAPSDSGGEEPVWVGEQPPVSFADFIKAHNPSLLDHEHVRRIVPVAEAVLRGTVKRLMVFLPPRFWKSEIFSRLLPAYHIRWWDEKAAIICHADHLALEFSEDARNYFLEDGGRMVPGTESKSRWASLRGGELWAAGLGARILGKGFNLGILDDPMDPEQVQSFTYQRRFKRFWSERYLPRQEPGARIILVMQRLGTEDPADYLFRREVGENVEKAPEHWHVLALDEIHSEEPLGRWSGPKGLPPTCTLVDDWRKPGELLAPGRFSMEETTQLRISSGPLVTAAQRQQRPMNPSGDFWQLGWFRTYKELPRHAYNGGRDWDTAFTKDEANSATAHMESYRGPGPDGQFPIYIHDVDWDHKMYPQLIEWMRSLSGPHYVEAKASGKSAVQSLAVEDIAAEEVQVKGDKLARASAVQSAVASRRVYVREDIFDALLRSESQGLMRVTVESLAEAKGALDVNDVFVQALHRHLGIHAEKRRRVRWA